MAESFLSPQQIAELWDIFDDGMATVEAFQRPAPVVQLRRMDEAAGHFVDVGDPVQLIAIRFGLREGTVTRVQQLEQDYVDGDIVLWADSPVLPEPGDTFTWLGKRIQVERVYPQNQSVVVAEVRLQQVAP